MNLNSPPSNLSAAWANTRNTCLAASIADHQHGASNCTSGVPAEQVVALFVLGITGSRDDLVALHLAFPSSALLALIPIAAKARAVDLNATNAALGVGFGAGGGATSKH